MDGKTHRTAGICTGLVIASNYMLIEPYSLYKAVPCVALVAGSTLGSLLPDIDHPDSMIGRKVKPISIMLNKGLGHRGIMHSPFIYMLIFMLFSILIESQVSGMYLKTILMSFMIGLLSGTFSHLFLDILTIGGIPLIYPFTKKKIRIFKFKSGSKMSKFITSGLFIGITVISLGNKLLVLVIDIFNRFVGMI